MEQLKFNIDIALKTAEFSEIVYNTNSEIYNFLNLKGYNQSQIIEDKSSETLVLVSFNKKEIIVCSRGTKNIRNWMTDCDIKRINWSPIYPKCKVHEGFKNAHLTVWTRVKAAICQYGGDLNIPIIFCGHSLGAAISLIQFVSWREIYGVKNELCYNFGQPRIGNRNFAHHIDELSGDNTVFRHIHLDDPVPRIPYRMGKFIHNNYNEIYWNVNDKPLLNPLSISKIQSDWDGILIENKHFLIECISEIEDKLFNHKSSMQGQILFPLLSDHSISLYKSILTNYKNISNNII